MWTGRKHVYCPNSLYFKVIISHESDHRRYSGSSCLLRDWIKEHILAPAAYYYLLTISSLCLYTQCIWQHHWLSHNTLASSTRCHPTDMLRGNKGPANTHNLHEWMIWLDTLIIYLPHQVEYIFCRQVLTVTSTCNTIIHFHFCIDWNECKQCWIRME